MRGRRSRVVLTPGVCASSHVVMLTAQPGTHISHLHGDGGNSASLPGESTKDTVKTIRAGKAGIPASPVVHPVRVLIAHGTSGACRCPAFLAPSLRMRAEEDSKARAKCAARPRRCVQMKCESLERCRLSTLRHCERSEAIQN
ncbi:hypothetical protein EHH60_21905 [Bradyrhizobium sp. RP6]|nr:hypothetical protein EHH60_21905 [Bradyrhizobium sp. RP6]